VSVHVFEIFSVAIISVSVSVTGISLAIAQLLILCTVVCAVNFALICISSVRPVRDFKLITDIWRLTDTDSFNFHVVNFRQKHANWRRPDAPSVNVLI